MYNKYVWLASSSLIVQLHLKVKIGGKYVQKEVLAGKTQIFKESFYS